MIFKKTTNLTLTQMAAWVDANHMLPDCDNDTLIEYLYHIAFSRTQQAYLFKDYETAEDFSIYCITKLLTRFKNNAEAPVKSVVNYLKNSLVHWYSEYVRQYCSGQPELDIPDFDLSDFSDYLIDMTAEYDRNAYGFNCFKLEDVVREHLKRIPRKKKSPEWTNIYISCLLTLQDRIKCAITIAHKHGVTEKDIMFNRIVRQLKTKTPILFHLDESMAPYIAVLVNELIHAISVELTYATTIKVLPSTCLKNLVTAACNEEDT